MQSSLKHSTMRCSTSSITYRNCKRCPIWHRLFCATNSLLINKQSRARLRTAEAVHGLVDRRNPPPHPCLCLYWPPESRFLWFRGRSPGCLIFFLPPSKSVSDQQSDQDTCKSMPIHTFFLSYFLCIRPAEAGLMFS